MRKIISFNDNWQFSKEKTVWENISLPHTWNAIDGCDGNGPYYRGACRYRKYFPTPANFFNGQRVCLEVLALSLSGTVYVNGKQLGSHDGGYSSFTLDITDALLPEGENELLILADNSEKSHIYPQMADFTFYGGLYRGVNLLLLSPVHFQTDYYGACGLAVTAEPVPDSSNGIIHLNSWINRPDENFTVCYTIYDAGENAVAESWCSSTDPKTDILLPNAHLWQGVDDPYLYRVCAKLVYRNETVDEVCSRFGIRSFSVDSEKGFFLNGRPMMLRGVARHQDRLYQGYALTVNDQYEDAGLIRELGANTIRLAHYQHSREFYDICDEYGFIVWAEIPYISCQSDDPAAHENCRQQIKELIYQNYNHPSICFWGISNEITIAGEKEGLADNHRDLNKLVKSIDPSRLTTMAHVSMLSPDSPLHGITDVESYNHYFGWYGSTYDNNEQWLDSFHRAHPEICLGLSEYGAEGIITYQPDEAKCRDYSEAYQAEYHEHMAAILMERTYLWSTHVWNMFDFGCAARNEGGTAGRNNKGLVTMDRKIKKEAFYVYKAYWSSEPFVYLCGRRYSRRTGNTTSVKVYSNQPQVTLFVNGSLFASKSGSKVFVFENVPLQKGFTFLTAAAHDCSDTITLQQVAQKPEIYTLPQEEDENEGVANWFEQASVPAADMTKNSMEFSTEHFSVSDKVSDIAENEEAYQVLFAAMRTITGMKLHKSMMGMMGGKTVTELADMMRDMGNTQNMPDNAMELINAALCNIPKH